MIWFLGSPQKWVSKGSLQTTTQKGNYPLKRRTGPNVLDSLRKKNIGGRTMFKQMQVEHVYVGYPGAFCPRLTHRTPKDPRFVDEDQQWGTKGLHGGVVSWQTRVVALSVGDIMFELGGRGVKQALDPCSRFHRMMPRRISALHTAMWFVCSSGSGTIMARRLASCPNSCHHSIQLRREQLWMLTSCRRTLSVKTGFRSRT